MAQSEKLPQENIEKQLEQALLELGQWQQMATMALGEKRSWQSRLEGIETLAKIGVWEMNLADKQMFWSKGLYQLLGLPVEVAPDMKRYTQALPEWHQERLSGALQKVFSTKQNYHIDHDIIGADGSIKHGHLFLSIIYDDDLQPAKLMGILQEMTESRQQQATLEKLSLVASKTSNAALHLNTSKEITWTNPAFTAMTGHFAEKAIGQPIESLIDTTHWDWQQPQGHTSETRLETMKTPIWVLANVSATIDFELNTTGYIVMLTDISQRKKDELRLEKQHKELQEKNRVIERKNAHITGSINYARRIQEAILPQADWLSKYFQSHFILFKPRDIVSGDFYWMSDLPNGQVFIAAIDCTGHGVPGAFMSLMANDFMNEIILEKGVHQPAEVLKLLHQKVRSTLKQGTNRNSDGMDMACCLFDWKSQELQYAGAKNPMLLIMPDGEALKINACKYSVGGGLYDEVTFENKTMPLKEGMRVYLYSDGYQDQFGGADKKKFMSKNFRTFLHKNSQLPMPTQKEIMSTALQSWMKEGNESQTDDILVVGLEV